VPERAHDVHSTSSQGPHDVSARIGKVSPVSSLRARGIITPTDVAILQGAAGNTAVQRLLSAQRDGPVTDVLKPPAPAGKPGGTGASVRLGDQSGYITAAQGYITSYRTAALAGITDFQSSLAPDFDWSLFGAQVAGNVIWAAACFTTGGTAFMISIAGITLTTGAAAGSVTSAPTFQTNATMRINDVDRYLNGRVTDVVADVFALAQKQGWDDNRTREEILNRMFASSYIVRTPGGLPNVDAPAIQATVQQRLLIEANATQPMRGSRGTGAMGHLTPTMIREKVTGYLLYSYKVGNIKHDEGFFHHDTMNDISAWQVGSGPSVALVPSANTGDINTSMNTAQLNLKSENMHIASWPCKKAINLYSDQPEDPAVIVRFNEANALTGVDGWGVVGDYLKNHDQLAFGLRIAGRTWGGAAPPDVAKLSAPPELFEYNPAIIITQ
jgi:hypothetical protein